MTRQDAGEAPAIVIPRTVFWGLLVPMVTAICLGSGYMAVLSMTVANQGTNQADFSVRIRAIETKIDNNKDASNTTTGAINDRLTRMEAQLSFLVKTSEAKK